MINEELSQITPDEINEMEERRIASMEEAGIDEREVMDKAQKDENTWQTYFDENNTRGKADAEFALRDQWTAVERSEFSRLFKPAMMFNKLRDPIKKVVAEQRKNKPDLMVRSLTGRASQEQIDLRADLVRTISYQSQNDLIYQNAFKGALTSGYGAFQICLDYERPRSFNQILRYDMIQDPTLTSFDPSAIKPHKGDGNFCSRRYIFSKQQFYATYPYISDPISYVDPRTLLNSQWENSETIIVNDRFVKEWYPLIVYKLSNGQTVTAEEWEELQEEFAEKRKLAEGALVVNGMILNEIPKIVMERQTQDYRIMHYRMIKDRIIDFSLWPSKFLPIIFVDGDSSYIDGKQYTHSFIHDAKDAQRFINYVGSEIAAEIKNRRREQWMATPDNVSGREQMWRNPEQQIGALIAKPDPKTGMMPQKMQPWDLSPALLQNFQRGSQDIREILGFSETEQLQGRDISGKARRERKLEGSMSAYVYFDNLNQAIEQGGRVVNDMLNHVMGEDERYFVVTKKDGRTEPIIINKVNSKGQKENVLEEGDFDVEIDTGPSFAVQKDIAIEFLQETLQAYPQVFPLVADLWAKNLDVQFMQQISDRFKTLVPPQIIAEEEGKELPPQPPSPQEQMAQVQMQLAVKELQEREQELMIRQEKHQIEKAELLMKAKELAQKLQMNKVDKAVDLHKADLKYTSDIASILAGLHR